MSKSTRQVRAEKQAANPERNVPPTGRAEKRALAKADPQRLYVMLEKDKETRYRKHVIELLNENNPFKRGLIRLRYLLRQRDARDQAQARLEALAAKHRLPLDIPGRSRRLPWVSKVLDRLTKSWQLLKVRRALAKLLGRNSKGKKADRPGGQSS